MPLKFYHTLNQLLQYHAKYTAMSIIQKKLFRRRFSVNSLPWHWRKNCAKHSRGKSFTTMTNKIITLQHNCYDSCIIINIADIQAFNRHYDVRWTQKIQKPGLVTFYEFCSDIKKTLFLHAGENKVCLEVCLTVAKNPFFATLCITTQLNAHRRWHL